MKKRIVTAVITACLALCAAVWPQPDVNFEYRAPLARETSPTLTEI